LVPQGAEWLLFDLSTNWGLFSVVISLDGKSLSYTTVSNVLTSTGWRYTVYMANISAFSGQMANLVFSGNGEAGILDDIRFSSTPVPEPGGVALMALGSGVVIYVSRRKHR
jgi:hypothetical protein